MMQQLQIASNDARHGNGRRHGILQQTTTSSPSVGVMAFSRSNNNNPANNILGSCEDERIVVLVAVTLVSHPTRILVLVAVTLVLVEVALCLV